MNTMQISISNLEKSFGNHKVLKGLNLTLTSGKIYGLIGNNGVGKTTTMSIMTGMIKADAGKITGLKGLQIGYLPETPAFYDYMTMKQYLKHVSRLSGVPLSKASPWIEAFQLQKALPRKIQIFSRGMRQKLGIIACLMLDPDFVILDEPSSALDPEGRHQVLEVVKMLKNDNKTVILSSHILNDVENICDEIALMHDGKIVLTGPPSSLMNGYSSQKWQITMESGMKIPLDTYDAAVKALKELLASGEKIVEFSEITPSLDEVFRKVVTNYETT